MFEDWSVDVDQADERAAQTPVTQSKLDGLDRRLLDSLAAHQGRGGIYPGIPRLAELLGVSHRTVQRRLTSLEAAGYLERVAVFERDDDPEWQRRGHRPSHPRRQTSNTYRLVGPLSPGPGDTEQANVPAQTPVTPEFVSPPEGKEVVQPVSERGLVEAPRAREPIEIPVEPPESAMLDHWPAPGEVLDTLGRSFGEVLVLEGPATYRMARGRLLDLAGSLADFHAAVDQLERDTCMDNGCQPGHRCRRHTRRERT